MLPGEHPEWRNWLRSRNPIRHALIASCTCGEGVRTPFLPTGREEPGHNPFPTSPPELIEWCLDHERQHAYDVLEEWERPHWAMIWNTTWQEGCGRGNWNDTDFLPVLCGLGETWTTYEAAHPGNQARSPYDRWGDLVPVVSWQEWVNGRRPAN